MDIKKIVGSRINCALARCGMLQKDLAKVLGVTDNTISYYCKGVRAPQLEQLTKIADVLNTTTDYLLGRTETQSPDMDIQTVANKTGLSEKNAALLCYTQNYIRTQHNQRSDDAALHQSIEKLANVVGLGKIFEECETKYNFTPDFSMGGSDASRFANDTLDAYTSSIDFMEDYASMLCAGKNAFDCSELEIEDFNNAVKLVESHHAVVLDPSDYVCYKSSEISRAIQRFLAEKYNPDEATERY